MQIHPDAPANPLYNDLKQLLDWERALPFDYKRQTKLRTIQIAEHNEQIIKQKLLQTQNICLPTMNHLRNERNINQLQERVYQTLTPHFDTLNICILKSRTADQADYCFSDFNKNFQLSFKPALKNILLEY